MRSGVGLLPSEPFESLPEAASVSIVEAGAGVVPGTFTVSVNSEADGGVEAVPLGFENGVARPVEFPIYPPFLADKIENCPRQWRTGIVDGSGGDVRVGGILDDCCEVVDFGVDIFDGC